MKKTILVVSTLLLSAASLPLQAEIYQYTDNKGTIQLVDDLSRVPKKYRKKVREANGSDITIIDSSPAPSSTSTRNQPAATRRRFSGTVELYGVSWCGYCSKMEQFLQSQGVSYTRYDVEKDREANRRFKELGGNGYPLTRIGNGLVHGYDTNGVIHYLENGGKK